MQNKGHSNLQVREYSLLRAEVTQSRCEGVTNERLLDPCEEINAGKAVSGVRDVCRNDLTTRYVKLKGVTAGRKSTGVLWNSGKLRYVKLKGVSEGSKNTSVLWNSDKLR